MMPGAHGTTVSAHVGGVGVTVGLPPVHGPHVIPVCHHCHNTHRDGVKLCKYCVCEKCHGTGINEKKHKACKKLKVHH